MSGRVYLLVTSPRLPAGLLTAQAWDLVRAHPVLIAHENEQAAALRAGGAAVTVVEARADRLLAALAEQVPAEQAATGPAEARRPAVVWLAGPGGDEDLARDLGHRLVREPALAELEVVVGSWDPPGARLLDAVTVMDRLLSPDGGDPWKRSQTHRTLATYLLEEAYEAYDAIDAGDLRAMREELGDVLLQVVLHAGMAAAASEDDHFDVDDVAGDLVDKLIRRNPHVFAGASVGGIEDIVENWEQIKKAEKARASVLDGVAVAQPALSLATKILDRVDRAGLVVDLPDGPRDGSADALGATLLAIVADARSRGLDAEGALRRAVLAYADVVRRAEGKSG